MKLSQKLPQRISYRRAFDDQKTFLSRFFWEINVSIVFLDNNEQFNRTGYPSCSSVSAAGPICGESGGQCPIVQRDPGNVRKALAFPPHSMTPVELAGLRE
jgi:hypothetical protein